MTTGGDGVELRTLPLDARCHGRPGRLPAGADVRAAPEALEDTDHVDFSPTDQFAPVLRHLRDDDEAGS